MKALATLSLDLDNQWSYMKTHGDPGWEDYPSYLNILIPYATDLLSEFGYSITFFIVGRDAADEKNSDALSLIVKRGHEVGNHSFEHEPWLHRYSRDAILHEISRTDELIREVTGQSPVGFRGPGYCYSSEILEVLVDLGYLFDASILPTFIGPLARAYYFWKSSFSEAERKQRHLLFGKISNVFRSLRSHMLQLPSGRSILEIPVTTIPILRTPFHLSYLLYLSRFSLKLMNLYLETALSLCRTTGTEPSFLLHPLDLLGKEQVPELRFFPGMDISTADKRMIFKSVMRRIARSYRVVPMGEFAKSIISRHSGSTGEYAFNER